MNTGKMAHLALWAAILYSGLLFQGCAVKNQPYVAGPQDSEKAFAKCPVAGEECWLTANDKYVGVGHGSQWGDATIDIYDAKSLKKITTINDLNVMEEEYLLYSGKNTLSHKDIIIDNQGASTNITFRELQKTISIKRPQGYECVLDATLLNDAEFGIIFEQDCSMVFEGEDTYLVATGNISQPNILKTLKTGALKSTNRSVLGHIFGLLNYNSTTGNRSWRHYMSVMPGNQKNNILVGLTSELSGCNSSHCEVFDIESKLMILDKSGQMIGELAGANNKQLVSYGRAYKVRDMCIIAREPNIIYQKSDSMNINSDWCILNPETGATRPVENLAYMWNYNKYNIFYSPDSKVFIAH